MPTRDDATQQVLRGAVQFAADGFDTLTARIHDIHHAIAAQPFGALARVPAIASGAAPVRLAHDSISAGVYGSVRLIGTTVFAGLDAALRASAPLLAQTTLPPETRRAVDLAASAASGVFGDRMASRRNPLTPRMGFYVDQQRLSLNPASLRAQFPDARRRLVVFVHGLSCNEQSWQLYRQHSQPYGERFGAAGYTALYLRYNTGLHISRNARRLAQLLTRLSERWPQPIEEIVLVGHSMGGLVIRAACAVEAQAWTAHVRHVVCLGSPHRGAPLEKGVQALCAGLDAFALTAPWGRLLAARSRGIRDLRFGATSEADWRAGARREWHPAQPLPRLAHARYHFIGSSIGRNAGDRLGQALGDGLVRLPSALAADLADADTAVLFGLHHLRLLNDAHVAALLADQLGLRPDR